MGRAERPGGDPEQDQTPNKINGALGKNFVTTYGTKRGILVLGKTAPFGSGAIIGAGGNAASAQFAIRSTKKCFGLPPDVLPVHLRGASPDEPGFDVVDAELVGV